MEYSNFQMVFFNVYSITDNSLSLSLNKNVSKTREFFPFCMFFTCRWINSNSTSVLNNHTKFETAYTAICHSIHRVSSELNLLVRAQNFTLVHSIVGFGTHSSCSGVRYLVFCLKIKHVKKGSYTFPLSTLLASSS